MATLEQLRSRGDLGRALPRLLAGQQIERRFYFTKRFKEWFSEEMPLINASFWGEDVPIKEQINGIIRSFVAGEDLHLPGQLHVIEPIEFGVWQLKTGDLRLFGWFPEIDVFVASTGGSATDIKDYKILSYYCKCMWTVSERNALDLDRPKFLMGVERHDVLGT